MKIDFILCYELWQRELHGIELLKEKLEKRGYKVRLLNIQPGIKYYMESFLYEPNVILFPWTYSDEDIKKARMFRGKCQKIVNMQCEQILSKRVLENGFFRIKKSAVNAYHVSWGANSEERYLDAGVPAEHIWKVGSINLEVNKDKYDDLFCPRTDLAKKYNLNPNKKWLLFCSNFKFDNMRYTKIAQIEKKSSNVLILAKEMKRAKKEILNWIFNYLKEHEDTEIIYRPHPVELEDAELIKLEKQFENFKYISKLTIYDWIRACDKCATWNSTSVIDSLYMGKASAFFQPYKLHPMLCSDMDDICNTVRNYEEFKKFVEEEDETFKYKNKLQQCIDTDRNALDNLENFLIDLHEKEECTYWGNELSQYEEMKKMQFGDKIGLLLNWMAKYVKIYSVNKDKRNRFVSIYQSKVRERKIYERLTERR